MNEVSPAETSERGASLRTRTDRDSLDQQNCTASAQPHDTNNTITGYNPKIRNFGYDPLAYVYYTTKGGGLGFQQTFTTTIPFDLDDLLFTKSSTGEYPLIHLACQTCALVAN